MIKSVWKCINIIAISPKRGMEQAEIIDTFSTYQRHGGGSSGISAGPRQAQREGEVSREGEGGARGLGAAALPPLTIYRALGGASALGDPISKGWRRPRGKLAPQAKWGAPHP